MRLVEVKALQAALHPGLTVEVGNGDEDQHWEPIGVTDGPSGCFYHVGRYELDETEVVDWTEQAYQWLSSLDPSQIDAQMLEGLGMFEEGGQAGAAGVLAFLKGALRGE